MSGWAGHGTNQHDLEPRDRGRWRAAGVGAAGCLAVVAIAVAIALWLRDPWDSGRPADVKRGWETGNRQEVAFDLEHDNLLRGWTREQVRAAFGEYEGEPTTKRWDQWSSFCSDPGCYWLTVFYDENDLVKRVSSQP